MGHAGTAVDRRRFLVRMTCGLLLAKSTWFSATAVLPQLVEQWQLAPYQEAGLTVAVQVGFVAGAVASSVLVLPDRWRPQRLIATACVGAAVANGLLLASPDPTLALALRFLTGASIAGVYPPALKLAVTWFPGRRGMALGMLVGALTVSSAVPHLVNGLGGLDWRTVVAATSVLTILGGALLSRALTGPSTFPIGDLRLGAVRTVVADRGVRLAMMGYLGHMWELYAMWAWFAIFFADSLGLHGVVQPRAHAYVTFAVIAAGGLGNVAGGLVGDRWGHTRSAAGILALSATCAVAAGPARHTHPALLAVLGIAWGVLVVADSPLFSALVTEVAPQGYVGTALTVQMAAGFAVTSVSIGGVAYVRSIAGWDWAFSFLVVGPLLGIVSMRRLSRIHPGAVHGELASPA